MNGRLLELTVDSIAGGGDGVARDEGGRVVFVPRTAPGDRVRARVEREKASWARALPVELLEAGAGRAPAPCPYYPACGGCQLQHLVPEARREALRRAVADALERIGGLSDARVPVPAAPGPEFGYRNRITLTLRRGPDGVRAGYRPYDDPDAVLDVEDCPLAEPAVRRAWAGLRGAWGPDAEALPAGGELRLTLRASAEGRVALVIEGGEPGSPGDPERVVAGLAHGGEDPGIHWRDTSGTRRRLAGEPFLEERWDGLDLRLRPEAFVQVNRTVAAAVDRHVEELVGPREGLRVLDLYAGVGVRAIRWALAGAEVVACEVDRDAVASGREAAERAGARLRFVRARVEDALGDLLPADRVVVNPPRAGLSRPVTERLAAGGLRDLVYVSCDPATLARDVARLGPAWRLEAVRTFDAFPQTAHVETVVRLEASGASEGAPEAPAEGA